MNFLTSEIKAITENQFYTTSELQKFHKLELCLNDVCEPYPVITTEYGKVEMFFGHILHENKNYYILRLFFEDERDLTYFILLFQPK